MRGREWAVSWNVLRKKAQNFLLRRERQIMVMGARRERPTKRRWFKKANALFSVRKLKGLLFACIFRMSYMAVSTGTLN